MKNKITILILVVGIAIFAYMAFVKQGNQDKNQQIPVGDTDEKDNIYSYLPPEGPVRDELLKLKITTTSPAEDDYVTISSGLPWAMYDIFCEQGGYDKLSSYAEKTLLSTTYSIDEYKDLNGVTNQLAIELFSEPDKIVCAIKTFYKNSEASKNFEKYGSGGIYAFPVNQ